MNKGDETTKSASSKFMPDPIFKGELLKLLDRKSWERISTNRESVKKSLERLKTGPISSFVELASELGYLSHPEDEAHLRQDLLDREIGWFKDLPAENLEPILRAGIIEAIEQSINYRLPIDSYWVRGGDKVEVVIAKSPQQITVLFMTPRVILTPEIKEKLKSKIHPGPPDMDITVIGKPGFPVPFD